MNEESKVFLSFTYWIWDAECVTNNHHHPKDHVGGASNPDNAHDERYWE
jgi:hypothetical protein